MIIFELISPPVTLYTLIANTSGPFGNVPLPPSGVFVSSLRSLRSSVERSPGTAINENTVSPGLANGGCSNVTSIVPEPSASVPVYELLKFTS